LFRGSPTLLLMSDGCKNISKLVWVSAKGVMFFLNAFTPDIILLFGGRAYCGTMMWRARNIPWKKW
jgi:hypothetical protein